MTVNKRNKALASVKHSVGTANANGVFFNFLFLEYAVPVWCPSLAQDIHAFENVHRRARTCIQSTQRRDVLPRPIQTSSEMAYFVRPENLVIFSGMLHFFFLGGGGGYHLTFEADFFLLCHNLDFEG